jgi:hypothetical protein
VEGPGKLDLSGAVSAQCEALCTLTAAEGSAVTVSAVPGTNSRHETFGGACSGDGRCVVTLTGTVEVRALFEALPPPPPGRSKLTVAVAGNGSGRVTSTPPAFDCAAVCSEELTDGTALAFTATADDGSRFDGWEGACSGTAICLVTLDADLVVVARFLDAADPPDPEVDPPPLGTTVDPDPSSTAP